MNIAQYFFTQSYFIIAALSVLAGIAAFAADRSVYKGIPDAIRFADAPKTNWVRFAVIVAVCSFIPGLQILSAFYAGFLSAVTVGMGGMVAEGMRSTMRLNARA